MNRVTLVGFLKFLKREKKEEDELDLPPAPPLHQTETDDFSFDDKEFGLDLPDMPDLKEPEPKLDIPDFGMEQDELPSLPDIEPQIPPIRAPFAAEPQIPEPVPTPPPVPIVEPEPATLQPEPEEVVMPKHRIFAREKRYERPARREVYVKIDKFRAVLENINTIRGDLRKSEELLMKLENLKNAKDRSFDKVKSSLGDLQKKLIFADRTLFKGE